MAIQVVNKFKHTSTEFDVYIGRGSGLGNPFHFKPSKYKGVIPVANRDEACCKYSMELAKHMRNPKSLVYKRIHELAAQYIRDDRMNLVCFCKPQRCHGDSIKQAIYRVVRGDV